MDTAMEAAVAVTGMETISDNHSRAGGVGGAASNRRAVYTDAELRDLIRNVNRSDVWRATGIHLSHVSRVFNGKRTASARNLERLSAYFDVRMGDLHRVLSKIRKDWLRAQAQAQAQSAASQSRKPKSN